MLKILKREQGWTCYGLIDQELQHASIKELIDHFKSMPVTLKNDKRSFVKKGDLNGQLVVAKQPVDKNRRTWSRFLSLIRAGEAMQTLLTMLHFKELGIPAVAPLLVLEKRKFGFLIDSWLVYEFREGEPANKTHLPQIVQLLRRLHQHGFRHDDPNYGNFLLDQNEELFLIDCKGRSRVGTLTDNVDYYLLTARNPDVTAQEVQALSNASTKTLGYQLSRCYIGYKNLRNRWKIILRGGHSSK